MQSALSQIPIPEAQTLAIALLSFIGGMAVPTRFGIERIEGFGRWVAVKWPYLAPAGKDEETAMIEATGGDPEAVRGGESDG